MQTDKITLSQLESFLLKAADMLRGKRNASEFKEFIFGLLFLKRRSDEFERKRTQPLSVVSFVHSPSFQYTYSNFTHTSPSL